MTASFDLLKLNGTVAQIVNHQRARPLTARQLGAGRAAAGPRGQREVVATGRYFFDIIGKYAVPFIFWAITLRLGEEEEEAAKPNAAPAKGRRRKKKG